MIILFTGDQSEYGENGYDKLDKASKHDIDDITEKLTKFTTVTTAIAQEVTKHDETNIEPTDVTGQKEVIPENDTSHNEEVPNGDITEHNTQKKNIKINLHNKDLDGILSDGNVTPVIVDVLPSFQFDTSTPSANDQTNSSTTDTQYTRLQIILDQNDKMQDSEKVTLHYVNVEGVTSKTMQLSTTSPNVVNLLTPNVLVQQSHFENTVVNGSDLSLHKNESKQSNSISKEVIIIYFITQHKYVLRN